MKKKHMNPAHDMKKINDKRVEALKSDLSHLKKTLPEKAKGITKEYTHLLDKNDLFSKVPQKHNIPSPAFVYAVIVGFVALDSLVLMNVYRLAVGLSGIPKHIQVIFFPVVTATMLIIYLAISHHYQEDLYAYQEKAEEAKKSFNYILDQELTLPAKPAKLITLGILKYVFVFAIMAAAIAVISASHRMDLKMGFVTLFMLDILAHLILIFFSEKILMAYYDARAGKLWKKRSELEMEKIRTENRIAIATEQWIDLRQVALNQFPNQTILFRDKFTPDEISTLNRLSTSNFSGVEAEKDKPLFEDWPPALPLDKKYLNGYDKVKGTSGSNLNGNGGFFTNPDQLSSNSNNNTNDNTGNVNGNHAVDGNFFFDETDEVQP